jgi:moderate conductance mechanosensitive channel
VLRHEREGKATTASRESAQARLRDVLRQQRKRGRFRVLTRLRQGRVKPDLRCDSARAKRCRRDRLSPISCKAIGTVEVVREDATGRLDRTLNPSDLDDICSTTPTTLCEQVFESTGGNELLTRLAVWLTGGPFRILLILVVAWILSRYVRRAIARVVRRLVASDGRATLRRLQAIGIDVPERLGREETVQVQARRESRAVSISGVLSSSLRAAIWSIALIMVLGEIGLDIGPIIAGAGIVGLAVGFGAQSLVKDCIAGLFVLLEDQYGVGDVVDLGEAVGTVESVGLRTTVARSVDGTVWHVPHGEVRRVGNKSQLWSTAVVDVDVAYDSDLAGVRAILLRTATELCETEEWSDSVLGEPEVLGIEALGADGITVRTVIKTAPGAQWPLQRALREAFKVAFDHAGIDIPFPQRTLWLRNQEA